MKKMMEHMVLVLLPLVAVWSMGSEAMEEGEKRKSVGKRTDFEAAEELMDIIWDENKTDEVKKADMAVLLETIDVNAVNGYGWTLLHLTCKLNNVEMVKWLVENGADVNMVIEKGIYAGETALHLACRKNKLEMVKSLIKEGAKLNVVDAGGWTSLHLACEQNNSEMVKWLVENGADVTMAIKKGIHAGETVLHWACKTNNFEMVKSLVQKGANLNAVDAVGGTPLHWACEANNSEMVNCLVENGADVNTVIEKGTYGETVLHWVCKTNNFEMAKSLTKKGANLNAVNAYGWTALHLACEANNSEIVKWLVENGADVTMVIEKGEDAGKTALHWACRNNNFEMVKSLVQKGANPNAVDADGWTALHLACEANNSEMVKWLVENGADVNMVSEKGSERGKTALLRACWRDNFEMVKFLTKKGANLHGVDAVGWTLLHWACLSNNSEIVKWLVENGADVTMVIKKGIYAGLTARGLAMPSQVRTYLKMVENFYAVKAKTMSFEAFCKKYLLTTNQAQYAGGKNLLKTAKLQLNEQDFVEFEKAVKNIDGVLEGSVKKEAFKKLAKEQLPKNWTNSLVNYVNLADVCAFLHLADKKFVGELIKFMEQDDLPALLGQTELRGLYLELAKRRGPQKASWLRECFNYLDGLSASNKTAFDGGVEAIIASIATAEERARKAFKAAAPTDFGTNSVPEDREEIEEAREAIDPAAFAKKVQKREGEQLMQEMYRYSQQKKAFLVIPAKYLGADMKMPIVGPATAAEAVKDKLIDVKFKF